MARYILLRAGMLFSLISLLAYAHGLKVSAGGFRTKSLIDEIACITKSTTVVTKHSLRVNQLQFTHNNERRSTRLFAIQGPIRYSSNNWIDCLLTLPSSRVLKLTWKFLFALTSWTALLTWLYKVGHLTYTLPIVVHSILGSALGLLLVFRTNSSYDR